MKKLKNQITKRFIIIALASILMSAVIFGMAAVIVISSQTREGLKDYGEASCSVINSRLESGELLQPEAFASEKYRITLIDSDGAVLYESKADTANMDNHLDRPEIQDALESGYGESSRRSDTFAARTYYSAFKLDNGLILRVATQESYSLRILALLAPSIIIVLVYVFLICVTMASGFTKRIITPIEDMAKNLNDPAYEELVPFSKTITEQRKELDCQMQQILNADKIRQTFTANVTHELKTPLTSISGYAEMIETGIARPEDVAGFAHKIHRESQRLVVLIEDILRLSQLETGDQNTVQSEENLFLIAKEVCSDLELNADKRGISIELTGENAVVLGDEKQLYELVYNLCDNAIRYNKDNGAVYVSVRNEENGDVCLKVRDTGIGIPADQKDKVFERFYRVDKSRSKKTGGTGLGLAIVKHIALAHNADITLDSLDGEYTCVTVNFKSADKNY